MTPIVKKQLQFICIMMFSAILFLLVYTFLHEIGHGIIGMLTGGTIDNITLGINAHISMHNTNYNNITLPLMNCFGMLFPYLICFIFVLFYNNKINNIYYHSTHFLSLIMIMGSVFPWVFIPIISFFAQPPQKDDVTKFMMNSGFHPLVVSGISLLLILLLAFVALKKQAFQTYIIKSRALSNQ
ncbi:hypothetical protein RBG61_04910 [Paludicola sp. MB14-C6]|uniref:hypothetical protein n=1 Tax=Paludihabitans sp. MB14-C6 TaxID=3070656 RepID=UPI0027DB8D06|nr:hypothetical protein [Paludicola sp. MB14-C6]WMJ24013.1 hypothetical protein RBG61_04910 [Paludicola sp. MB14-C6]